MSEIESIICVPDCYCEWIVKDRIHSSPTNYTYTHNINPSVKHVTICRIFVRKGKEMIMCEAHCSWDRGCVGRYMYTPTDIFKIYALEVASRVPKGL